MDRLSNVLLFLVTGEFLLDRSIVFVGVRFDKKVNIELLASIESTDCDGVRYGDKLVIFDKSVFELKDLFIVHAEIKFAEEQNYLLPNFDDFKKTLQSVKVFVKNPNMFPNNLRVGRREVTLKIV
ncbi:hypothetical protein POM88_051244 [Heracleum sosnowskyi]|uniref:Uncharacterized protein n=1 Tax=Heracleum sosnowskyi TaxID=360622 RepID=A0AAD8H1K1_9APIA|nr:hypothetical protein POM88_051244 [Heracleum sosnowskyi]